MGPAPAFLLALCMPLAAQATAAPSLIENAAFGEPVLVNGDCAVVGARTDGEDGHGRVYTFRRSVQDGKWTMVQAIESPTPAPPDVERLYFGSGVARDGGTLVVTSFRTGEVHLFGPTGDFCEFSHDRTLRHPDGRAGTVALDLPVLAVEGFESVQVWERDGGEWIAGSHLSTGDDISSFGSEMSLAGNILLVGEYTDADFRGTVFQYLRTSRATFVQFGVLTPPSPREGRQLFGEAIARLDDQLAIGMPGFSGAGQPSSIYTYVLDGNGFWTLFQELPGLPGQPGLGRELALSRDQDGSYLLAAGTHDRVVHLYRRQGNGPWILDEVIEGPSDGWFGRSMDFADTLPQRLLIGAERDRVGGIRAGSVRVYDLPAGSAPVFRQRITADRPHTVLLPGGSMLQMAEDSPLTFNIDIEDPDGGSGSYELAAFSSNTQLFSDQRLADNLVPRDDSGMRYRLTLRPGKNVFGTATIAVLASDDANEASAAVDVVVAPVNDPPAITLAETVISHPRGATGQRVFPGFVTSFDPGPGNEDEQRLAEFLVRHVGGSSGVASNVSVDANGLLHYILGGETGTASFELVARDDGGTERGGVDKSPPQSFSIQITATPPPQVDLSVTVDNRSEQVFHFGETRYLVRLRNDGPDDAIDAALEFLPRNLDIGLSLNRIERTRERAVADSAPTLLGDGQAIAFDLAAGEVIELEVHAELSGPPADEAGLEVMVLAPVDAVETDPSDNQAGDFDPLVPDPRIFGNGFESRADY